MSYDELLANARDRYRELYERLAPDGIPASMAKPDAASTVGKTDSAKPKKSVQKAVAKPARRMAARSKR